MRRKYERKLSLHWPDWGPAHAVHNAIKRGSNWLEAWYSQACTPWAVIERKTGLMAERLAAIERGAEPTALELRAMAKLWGCPVEHIEASIAASMGYDRSSS